MWFKKKTKVLVKVPIALKKANIKVVLEDNKLIEFSIEEKLIVDTEDSNLIRNYSYLSSYVNCFQNFTNSTAMILPLNENESLTIKSQTIKEVYVKYEKLRDDFTTKYIYE